jgi:hypothetical protein
MECLSETTIVDKYIDTELLNVSTIQTQSCETNNNIIKITLTNNPLKCQKNYIFNLPNELLLEICSIVSILGLTCKKLNALCPIKPINCKYNKQLPYYTIPKSIKPQTQNGLINIDFWYWEFNVNTYNELLESNSFRRLEISTIHPDFITIRNHIEYMLIKNINYDNFKYKKELDFAISCSGFTQILDKYANITMCMLFYLYH